MNLDSSISESVRGKLSLLRDLDKSELLEMWINDTQANFMVHFREDRLFASRPCATVCAIESRVAGR